MALWNHGAQGDDTWGAWLRASSGRRVRDGRGARVPSSRGPGHGAEGAGAPLRAGGSGQASAARGSGAGAPGKGCRGARPGLSESPPPPLATRRAGGSVALTAWTPQLQVSAQQAELELRRLREENEHLRRQLHSGPHGECGHDQGVGWAGSGPPPQAAAKFAPSSEERALLRQLKEVTDRQRDELRAHNRDLLQRSQETEAVRAGRGEGRGAGLSTSPTDTPPTFSFAPPPAAGAAAAPPAGEFRAAAQTGSGANPAACREGPRGRAGATAPGGSGAGSGAGAGPGQGGRVRAEAGAREGNR